MRRYQRLSNVGTSRPEVQEEVQQPLIDPGGRRRPRAEYLTGDINPDTLANRSVRHGAEEPIRDPGAEPALEPLAEVMHVFRRPLERSDR